MDNTKEYYEKNAKDFFDSTVSVDMESHYSRFLKYIPENASILDLGCGSGRDLLNFKNLGYTVMGIDGSKKLVEMARKLTGENIVCMDMRDISYTGNFDGIWACASLLHLNMEELGKIFKKIREALKTGGVVYCSFKYGDFEGERNGRYFTDMNEALLGVLLSRVGGFKVLEDWRSSDVRPGREDEKWLNVLVSVVWL